jgi:hypothetical protein
MGQRPGGAWAKCFACNGTGIVTPLYPDLEASQKEAIEDTLKEAGL